MAWRKLPEHLRGRVPRVSLLVALPAFVGTLLGGLVWMLAPLLAAYALAAGGHEVLAALAAAVALWWLYQMFREPLIPGLLLAAPASLWSVVQQQRGLVDTEDLERGRLVGLAGWRPPTTAETEVLRALVRQVDDLPELDRQIDVCEVNAECVCGCASIGLYSTGPAVPRDPARGNADGERDHLAFMATAAGDGGRRVDVVLHVRLGSIRELEVTPAGGAHDGTAAELPAAAALRPAGVRRTTMVYH